MRPFLFACIATLLIACAAEGGHSSDQHLHSGASSAPDSSKGSPPRMAMANIGEAHLHIEYNAPAVRKRIIWGGLVPYDEVWVTGAHDATRMQFSKPVEIAGTRIPAGKYAFFTIPGREEWTLILNRNWDQHLADEYAEAEDLLRWKAQPLPHAHTERLTYSVAAGEGEAGIVSIDWDTLRIQFEVKP